MDKNGLRVHQSAGGRTNITGADVVSGDCEYPELAIRLLDYGYSDEGHILWNFGKEGESFNYVDGYPKYADFIFDNSDGKTVPQKMGLHSQALTSGPFFQDVRYLEQYYATPQQQEATKAWSNTDVYDYMWPNAATFTQEESDEYNTIMSAILTYQGEMQQKFIVGAEPIEKYDEMVKKIKDMGLDRALEIRQAAYDRYIKR
jgi:putative aldouronate transport system substrate-binding protein